MAHKETKAPKTEPKTELMSYEISDIETWFSDFVDISDRIAGWWNPSKNHGIRGVLVGIREGIGAFGTRCFLVQTETACVAYPKATEEVDEGEGEHVSPGSVVAVWEGYQLTILEHCVGERVAIVYLGNEKTKTAGRRVKLYRIGVAAQNVAAVRDRISATAAPKLLTAEDVQASELKKALDEHVRPQKAQTGS
jgi:hypothetical protein